MARKRKTYTAEYELAAVKMVTDQELSVAEAARRLGISENRLREWEKALAAGGAGAFPGTGPLTPLEEEGRKPKAEIERPEMERDILKRAAAFFATHANGSPPGSRNARVSGRSTPSAAYRARRARGSARGGRGSPVPPTSGGRNGPPR